MNYYERHLGDYAKDTSHLSLLEHGVYTLLLDRYYATEAAIPADQVYRLARARSRDERAAVDTVLADFFQRDGEVWRHNRCDAEIAAYNDGEPERAAKKANEDNRLRRHREERARLFKALTDAGEHAPWNIAMAELRERVAVLKATQPATRYKPLPATAPATLATATQTPDTIHQRKAEACAPPLPADTPAATPPAIEVPMTGRRTHPVTEADVARLRELHPGIDAMHSLRRMVAWLEADPSRQSATTKGVRKRIASWLGGDQDRAGSGKPRAGPTDTAVPKGMEGVVRLEQLKTKILEERRANRLAADGDPRGAATPLAAAPGQLSADG